MFELYLCEVIGVDIVRKRVSLRPLLVDVGIPPEMVMFAAPYAPIMAWRPADDTQPLAPKLPVHPFDDDPLGAAPAGQFCYPKPGEMVMVAALKHRAAKPSINNAFDTSYELTNAIIICRVFDDKLVAIPKIGYYDQLWLDKSGSKIHFNHRWNDSDPRNVTIAPVTTNKEGEEIEEEIAAAQGHLTIVGNRRVDLIGDKFAGFGLLSHLFIPGKEDSELIITKAWYPPEAEGNELAWGKLFSRDATKAYEPNFAKPDKAKFVVGTTFWLEPPCPETGAYMRMHQSGQKLVVSNVPGLEGQEIRFLRNRVTYIGSGVFPLSFDPDDVEVGHGLAENSTEGSTETGRDGHDLTEWVYSSGKSAKSLIETDGLKSVELGGLAIGVPASGTLTDYGTDIAYPADAGKVKIKVGNAEIIIDSSDDSVTITAAGKFTITGDLEVTGNIKTATGNIEATAGDVKGATGTF